LRRRFSVCHLTYPLSSIRASPTSAYPTAFPSAFATSPIVPHVVLVGAYLLHRPFRKSQHGVTPFQVIVCRCFRLALYAGLLVYVRTGWYVIISSLDGERSHPSFHHAHISGQAIQPFGLFNVTTLQSCVRFTPLEGEHLAMTASRAGSCRFRLAAYPHVRPASPIDVQSLQGGRAIGAHIEGSGLRLTSMTQLSGHSCLAAHPPSC
jgi:hypothetical protein